ncbi:hypothetical protein [Marivita geojedonensis]|uniref:Uncharacterized protein n=1 Tax=Marivita geojedonensis TaxID=1123756 RepID=A0A1X4N9I8_9RHOB|nr:hypothetical protein [Marivita geojedonensis]OSQ42933.1 hypothetical protein MGEO_20145 [Marivita geojedonensis]PRY72135.1 hypothetical protein CLV76_13816 [Marivita geojedonensis]
MSALAMTPPPVGRSDTTVKMTFREGRIIASEQSGDKVLLIVTELALCLVGVLALMCGTLLIWFSFQPLTISLVADPLWSGASLIAVGLGLYAYGTRGFNRQVIINLSRRTAQFGRVNSSGSRRINRTVPFEEIKSLYVQKSSDKAGSASLMMRVGNRSEPYCVLTGRDDQLRELHGQICRALGTKG